MKKNLISQEKLQEIIKNGPYRIRFPKSESLEQDEEWCEVQINNNWKKIRFHDYGDVYKVPGLYETIFYRTLMCNSPHQVASILADVLTELHMTPSRLRVLDFGAGNGMAGEALQRIGVRKIVGVDINDQAEKATMRDRPWVYDEYKVCDITSLSEPEIKFFREYKFNTLTIVAALGFGDIPPKAFFNAFNLVENEGLIAFNIRDNLLKKDNKSKFSRLIRNLIQNEVVEIESYKRYRHRLNILGEPIYYVAIVAKKLDNISIGLME